MEVYLRHLYIAKMVPIGKLCVRIEKPPLAIPLHDGVVGRPALHGEQKMTPVVKWPIGATSCCIGKEVCVAG